jgi:hypothetical protein
MSYVGVALISVVPVNIPLALVDSIQCMLLICCIEGKATAATNFDCSGSPSYKTLLTFFVLCLFIVLGEAAVEITIHCKECT